MVTDSRRGVWLRTVAFTRETAGKWFFFGQRKREWRKVPFRVAKIGSTRLPVPQRGSDLYRKNDYTQ